MIYKQITINGTDYKLRMTGKSIIEVEKKLGNNPLNILTSALGAMQVGDIDKMTLSSFKMPKLTDLLYVFWGALLPMNSKISFDAACDLYTDYISDGHSYDDFLTLMLDVLTVSGFMKAGEETEDDEGTEKN